MSNINVCIFIPIYIWYKKCHGNNPTSVNIQDTPMIVHTVRVLLCFVRLKTIKLINIIPVCFNKLYINHDNLEWNTLINRRHPLGSHDIFSRQIITKPCAYFIWHISKYSVSVALLSKLWRRWGSVLLWMGYHISFTTLSLHVNCIPRCFRHYWSFVGINRLPPTLRASH